MSGKNEYTLIAGCGRLGASLAGKLSDAKKDVMVLDCDKNAFRKLPCSYGGLTMVAGATDIEKLNAANLKDATTFIAVTDYDCVNICASQIAKKVYHIPKVVARIYDKDKTDLVKELGIDTICPAELSENEIVNYLKIGGKKHVG
ncbi:MAG: NAD-binding protein [Eubacterium sp.]|nr:NAD-binding protein [Eubacterium sp.]MDD7209062.1 NAD-binding protein [Lachnospiraceae bacterium]MDY5496424.1 NAD-binding protein [Anaerobutyricum sp.]